MKSHPTHKTLLHTSLVLLLLTPLQTSCTDTHNPTPTRWTWLQQATPTTINNHLESNYRLTNLHINTISPFRLSALLVRNTAPHHLAQSWWFYHVTITTLRSHIADLDARITNINVYYLPGSPLPRFAVLLVPNTGAARKVWHFYYHVTAATVVEKLREHNARPVDIHAYKVVSDTRYAVVMIENTGSDHRDWKWYPNATPSFITSERTRLSMRLKHIQQVGLTSFSAILEEKTPPFYRWGWHYGLSAATLQEKATQSGMRLIRASKGGFAGISTWTGIMIENLNDVEREAYFSLVDARAGGSFGFYMRELSGGVHAKLMESYVYEPASSIKALHLAHAMKRVQDGADALSAEIRVYRAMILSCPLSIGGRDTYSVRTALEKMMRVSSNQDTNAIRKRYGEDNINRSAQRMGMSQSRIKHTIGCGADQVANPNWLTLRDIGKLYEAVATTWLTEENRATFFNIMSSYPAIFTVFDEEAAKIPQLADVTKTAIRNRVVARQKGGSYSFIVVQFRSVGGYVKLPFRSPLCCLLTEHCRSVVYKEYVMGAFIDWSTKKETGGTVSKAAAETMRGEIRESLLSYIPCKRVFLSSRGTRQSK